MSEPNHANPNRRQPRQSVDRAADVKFVSANSSTRHRSPSPPPVRRRGSRSRSRSRSPRSSRERDHQKYGPRDSSPSPLPPTRYLKKLFDAARSDMQLGSYQSADRTFTEIFEVLPKPLSRDYLNRAFVREHLKDYDNALADIDRAEAASNNHPILVQRINMRRASVYSKTGNAEKANELLSSILRETPNYKPALNMREKINAIATAKLAAPKQETKAGFDGQPVSPLRLSPRKLVLSPKGITSPPVTLVLAPPVSPSVVVASTVNPVSSPPAPSSSDDTTARPLSTWDVQAVANWFGGFSPLFQPYVELVKANSLSGDALSSIVGDGESEILSSMADLGITNGIHQKVLTKQLLKLIR